MSRFINCCWFQSEVCSFTHVAHSSQNDLIHCKRTRPFWESETMHHELHVCKWHASLWNSHHNIDFILIYHAALPYFLLLWLFIIPVLFSSGLHDDWHLYPAIRPVLWICHPIFLLLRLPIMRGRHQRSTTAPALPWWVWSFGEWLVQCGVHHRTLQPSHPNAARTACVQPASPSRLTWSCQLHSYWPASAM